MPTLVRFRRNGAHHSFAVPDSAMSILDAGLDAGLDMPYSCCAGICTSCVALCISGSTRPISGHPVDPTAIDEVLSPAEQAQGYILCCQRLPASALVELDFDQPLAAPADDEKAVASSLRCNDRC